MITKPRALPDEKIKEIQLLYKKHPWFTYAMIAKMYFVDPNTIRNYLKLKL
jgi:hypothetical protein